MLLVPGASAAAPSAAEQAYRAARDAADRNDLPLARRKTEEALARLGNASDEWTWALRILKGELLLRQADRREEGLTIIERELPPTVQTSEAAVRRLIVLGFLGRKKGAFESALDLATKYQPRLTADVHSAWVRTAPIVEAEAHARAATQLAKRYGRPLTAAVAANQLSQRYTTEQRYAEAVDLGEQALATFRKMHVDGRFSSACGNLGWAYSELGDYETAAELFTCAEASSARVGAEADRVAWLNQLGNMHHALRAYPQGEQYYKQALSRARGIGSDEVPTILTNLARLYADTGRFAEARALNNEALDLKRRSKAEEDVLRSLLVDAQIDAVTANYARAEKTLQTVLDADAKYAATRWEADARLGELYARMQRSRDAETHFARAIETARKAREGVKTSELKLPFFNAVEEVFEQYVDFLVRAKRVDDALAVTEESRAQTLEEGLQIAGAQRRIDPRLIAQQQNVTILCYWLGRDRSYVWTVTPGGVTIATLPADTIIESAVDAYRRDLLAPGPRASLQGSARRGGELYQMIVAPAVRALPKDARVTIIADGKLHALSFDTLVVQSPRPHYWIEDAVITSASSLQLLARASSKHTNAPAMLLVGNALPADPAYPPLANAAQEMQTVAQQFAKRVVLEGAKATPAAYRAATPGAYDYLHFVAHGVATRTHPLDSAVILGRDGTRAYKLFARDIIKEPLHARLVTISSCHGAGSRTYAGEGLVGLAWAFLRAGAEQVIAALWEVNDNATPRLMDRMYKSIRAGRDPALALRDAKLELIRSNTVYKNARYWAPFVLYSGS